MHHHPYQLFIRLQGERIPQNEYGLAKRALWIIVSGPTIPWIVIQRIPNFPVTFTSLWFSFKIRNGFGKRYFV